MLALVVAPKEETMSSVFLCHRKVDSEKVKKLAAAISKVGHDVWFDEWEIGVGDSIVERVNSGLSRISYLVLCYSSLESSEWTDREWNSTLHRQLSGQSVKVLPVRLSGGEVPAILADVKYADLMADWDRGVADLLKAIK